MAKAPKVRHETKCIDAALLERMGDLARGFPGRTVSIARPPHRSRHVAEKIVLHIDGVAADEISAVDSKNRDDAA